MKKPTEEELKECFIVSPISAIRKLQEYNEYLEENIMELIEAVEHLFARLQEVYGKRYFIETPGTDLQETAQDLEAWFRAWKS